MKGIKQVNHFKLYKEILKKNDKSIYLSIDDRSNQLVIVKSYDNQSNCLKNYNELGIRMDNAKHDRLIKFHGKERTKHNSYFAYEYINGGKLSNLLQLYMKKYNGGFNESHVQSIMKQLIEGFAFMETDKVIQGDIGLEHIYIQFDNFVFKKGEGSPDLLKAFETRKYNIKIDPCIINSNNNRTVCNIPQESLLEEIERNNIRPRCAIWSLGIIVFELLFGKPFNNYNTNTTNNTLISYEALTFIKTVLTIPNHAYLTWQSIKDLSFISGNSTSFETQFDIEAVNEAILPKNSTIDSAYYSFIDLTINNKEKPPQKNDYEIITTKSKDKDDNWAVISNEEIYGKMECDEIEIVDIITDYFN